MVHKIHNYDLLALCIFIYFLFISQTQAYSNKLVFDLNNSSQRVVAVDQAFLIHAEISDGYLTVFFKIKPKHYLYKNRFKFIPVNNKDTQLGQPIFPQGVKKYDLNFHENIEIFQENITIKLPINSVEITPEIDVEFQGCAESVLCYAPYTFRIAVINPDIKKVSITNFLSIDTHEFKKKFLNVLFFLIAGIGLTFTPCVLPMIPILSSILVQAANKESKKTHILGLTITYVLSMSLTFTIAGTLMGFFGASLNLQAKLQSSSLLIPFALLFVLLSLSMFGVYKLQLPESFRDYLHKRFSQSSGFIGAFFMGILSALVVSPCISAPLAGALIYISTTSNAFLGGLSLFALGLGIGLPLLVIGIGGKHLLPKAGYWMNQVKYFFGFMLLGIAIWMLERVIPNQWVLFLWGSLMIVVSVYYTVFNFRKSSLSKFFQAIGITCLIYGFYLIILATKNSKNSYQSMNTIQTDCNHQCQIKQSFNTINTLATLTQQLKLAQLAGKPALVEVYADWCFFCKNMDKKIFSDPIIQQITKNWYLIKFDITDNTIEHQKWLDQYQLFGPPALLFFDDLGQELVELRSFGTTSTSKLQEKLNTVGAPTN